MLKSLRNRPEFFLLADFERYQELLEELDAQMKVHVQQFFAQELNQPKYHKQVNFICKTCGRTYKRVCKCLPLLVACTCHVQGGYPISIEQFRAPAGALGAGCAEDGPPKAHGLGTFRAGAQTSQEPLQVTLLYPLRITGTASSPVNNQMLWGLHTAAALVSTMWRWSLYLSVCVLNRLGSRKRKFVIREIVQRTQIDATLRPLDESFSHRQRDASKTTYDTPFLRAARTGEPQLANTTEPVKLEVRSLN